MSLHKTSCNCIVPSVTDVLKLLMNDNVHIKYQKLSRAEFFVIGPLTFVGFVIVNGILSNIKTYLIRPVLQSQILTLEDIYSSPYHIATYTQVWQKKLTDVLTHETKHQDWGDKIIAFEIACLNNYLFSFNTSMVIYLPDSYLNFILEAQKRLNIRGYYNTQICMHRTPLLHYLNEKFLFFDRFNEIYHRLYSAGLMDLWYRNTSHLQLRLQTGHSKHIEGNDVQRMELPMFIVYGWIASAMWLIIEIIWKNFLFSRMIRFQRIFREKIARLPH